MALTLCRGPLVKPSGRSPLSLSVSRFASSVIEMDQYSFNGMSFTGTNGSAKSSGSSSVEPEAGAPSRQRSRVE
jgi:hypothetical protein